PAVHADAVGAVEIAHEGLVTYRREGGVPTRQGRIIRADVADRIPADRHLGVHPHLAVDTALADHEFLWHSTPVSGLRTTRWWRRGRPRPGSARHPPLRTSCPVHTRDTTAP